MESIIYVYPSGYFSGRVLVAKSKLKARDFIGLTINGVKKYKMPFLKSLSSRIIKNINDRES